MLLKLEKTATGNHTMFKQAFGNEEIGIIPTSDILKVDNLWLTIVSINGLHIMPECYHMPAGGCHIEVPRQVLQQQLDAIPWQYSGTYHAVSSVVFGTKQH